MRESNDSSNSHKEIGTPTQLEHHRHVLQSITSRSIRVVQFDFLVFSVFAGLISFGQSPDGGLSIASVSESVWAVLGFLAVVIGITASIRIIVFETYWRPVAQRSLNELLVTSGKDTEDLFDHYRKRIRKSSRLLLVAYAFSFVGITMVLGGIVETAETTIYAMYFNNLLSGTLEGVAKQPLGALVIGVLFLGSILWSRGQILEWAESLPGDD